MHMETQTEHHFAGIEIVYGYNETHHHIAVRHATIDASGPWVSIEREPIITYEWANRFFVVQRLTDDLPRVFELIPEQGDVIASIPIPGSK